MDNTSPEQLTEMLSTQQAPAPSTPDEVLDTRTPEEIEAAFLKQAEDEATRIAENRDPAETAAIMFHMFYPKFKGLTMGLSNKELRRLVTALIGRGHTSEPDVPKFHDKNTGQAYKMGLELLQAKFMMIQRLELNALEKEHQEKEAKKLAAEAVVTTEYVNNDTETKEVNNE